MHFPPRPYAPVWFWCDDMQHAFSHSNYSIIIHDAISLSLSLAPKTPHAPWIDKLVDFWGILVSNFIYFNSIHAYLALVYAVYSAHYLLTTFKVTLATLAAVDAMKSKSFGACVKYHIRWPFFSFCAPIRFWLKVFHHLDREHCWFQMPNAMIKSFVSIKLGEHFRHFTHSFHTRASERHTHRIRI